MKSFNIYANTVHVFDIIASTFPKMQTLLFYNNNKTSIIASCTMELYSTVLLKYKNLFSVMKNNLDMLLYCANIIAPIKTKLSISFKTNSFLEIIFSVNNKINGGLINNIKIAFNNVNKTTIVASAMVGTFNTLGIFDPETLGTLDPYYLGDMDFNQT